MTYASDQLNELMEPVGTSAFAAEPCAFCSSEAALRHMEEAGWGPLLWEHKLHSFPTVYVCIHNKSDMVFIFDVHTQIEECYLSSEPKTF